jgi:hypothetical protein
VQVPDVKDDEDFDQLSCAKRTMRGAYSEPRGAARAVARSAHALHLRASFPREIRHPSRSFAERVFNIQRWTEMPRGGHFAALEAPDLLATDVATFVRSLGGR